MEIFILSALLVWKFFSDLNELREKEEIRKRDERLKKGQS